MSSFWEKARSNLQDAAETVKKGSAQAADKTRRATLQKKLQLDVELLRRKVKTAKQEFGVKVFDSMCLGDQATVSQVFSEYQAKVEGLENNIAQLLSQIQQLNTPDATITSTPSVMSSGFTQPASTTTTAPQQDNSSSGLTI